MQTDVAWYETQKVNTCNKYVHDAPIVLLCTAVTSRRLLSCEAAFANYKQATAKASRRWSVTLACKSESSVQEKHLLGTSDKVQV